MLARGRLLFTLALLGLGPASAPGTGPPPCPATATVAVFAENLSPEGVVALELDGELLDPGASCAGGAIRYAVALTCAGLGLAPCGRISNLNPGAWAHRLRVTVGDSPAQLQTQRTVLVGAPPPRPSNVLRWTVYPRTFVVTQATEDDLRAQLDAAAAFSGAHGAPALVTFSPTSFPGTHTPQTIGLTRQLCDDDRHNCAALRLEASRVIVDGLDAFGDPGAVVLSVGTSRLSLLRILGSANVIRGLVLEGTRNDEPRSQHDTLVLSGSGAFGNRVERTVIRGPTMGDAVGTDRGAGTPSATGTGPNVIDGCDISGARDKGLKATTGAHIEIRASCVHDNANGGIQSTLGGRIVAIENVVQHNVPDHAQNGLSVGGVPGGPEERSTLRTDGNIVRFSGSRGLSVADNGEGVFANDYVADNQFAGSRVETNVPGAVPTATFRGVALICNNRAGITGICQPASGPENEICETPTDCCRRGAGCCVPGPDCPEPARCDTFIPEGIGAAHGRCDNCAAPEVDYGSGAQPGRNAFAFNPSLVPGTRGINFNQAVPDTTVSAEGNQWERCGAGATCDTGGVITGDVRVADGASVRVGRPPGPRAGAPQITGVSPGRPAAGTVVRLFGTGFNAIDGAACAGVHLPSDPCSVHNASLAERNRCGGTGNCVELTIGGARLAVDLVALTPTMLAFRMPVDCYAPATLRASRADVGGRIVESSVAFCDPSGCLGEPADAPCDDGDACTVGDHCHGSAPVCVPGERAACDGPCESGVCEPARGCLPAPAATACSDEDACTVGDHCRGDVPVCVPGERATCDGPCESGVCEPVRGCLPAPATTACEDGDSCTVGDHCRGDEGTCTPGVRTRCEGPCLTGACDARGDCLPAGPTVACDDANACTVTDRCDGGGQCVPGAPRDCDDADRCTDDRCAPTIGCSHRPLEGLDAISCRTAALEADLAAEPGAGKRPRRLLDRAVRDVERARLARDGGDLRTAVSALRRADREVRSLLLVLRRSRGVPAERRRWRRDMARAALREIRTQRATLVQARAAAMPAR